MLSALLMISMTVAGVAIVQRIIPSAPTMVRLCGGFLVGIFENLAGTYIPVVGPELKLPVALFVIIAVLVVRPSGLLGRKIVQRV